MEKRLVITGAGGLVGLSLLTIIDTSKYKVVIIDKNHSNLKLAKKINPEIETHCIDLSSNLNLWEEIFMGASCVVQLQAQISDPERRPYVKNNILSVQNVVSVCEKYKIKNLIHLSSSVVMSVAKDNYSNSKTIGEEIVKNSKAPHTILRPSIIYGGFDVKHLGFLSKIIDISPIFPVPGTGKYIRQPIYVMDLCKIISRLIEKTPKRETYNIIGKEQIYFVDMVKEVAKVKKQSRLFIQIPLPTFIGLLRVFSFVTGKRPYETSQLHALIAGDIFPVENWDESLDVKYTVFKEGVKKMINSKYYKMRKLMEK